MKRSGYGLTLGILAAVTVSACGGTTPLPQPRSVVIFSGERIHPEPERMREVERWLRPQLDEIERNPTFLIRMSRQDWAAYPWETLELEGDTARIRYHAMALDAETPYMLYAHFHLMAERGELEPWAPEAAEVEGFERERAILKRIADVWLLGRSVFDTQAHEPLEELLYANEASFLEEFILSTQGDRFPEERAAFEADEERKQAFREWFQRTFDADGPRFVGADGRRGEPSGAAPPGRDR